MKSRFMTLACAGILILPAQSFAESRQDSGVSTRADRDLAVSAMGVTHSRALATGATGTEPKPVSPREPTKRAQRSTRNSELNAAVEAQDQLLERKLKGICRGC
jgi:hypothetical protein